MTGHSITTCARLSTLIAASSIRSIPRQSGYWAISGVSAQDGQVSRSREAALSGARDSPSHSWSRAPLHPERDGATATALSYGKQYAQAETVFREAIHKASQSSDKVCTRQGGTTSPAAQPSLDIATPPSTTFAKPPMATERQVYGLGWS
jgi:hypothetical protein